MPKRVDILSVPLGGVDLKECRVMFQKVGNGGDRLPHAGLVVDVHHADQQRIGPQRFANGVRIDLSGEFGSNARHAKAAAASGPNRLNGDGC